MLYEVILLELHEVHAIVGVVVSINGGILLCLRSYVCSFANIIWLKLENSKEVLY